ncbi:hypothetical protein AVMA1855_20140 [Acidovorax sp. SUPP1855]|uniref:hypothetical protein n=1 Tax=Acidovorax sp. SUPP1855 TaxID=431774 RepID=UPI0023DE2007|nr:hypothetical protein [Acidovorax sp. SUPP1855]GKS86502.1 hypothetical protein AVMA1855_20140 [Acidovorax sp. SUPP1855]
MHGRIWLRGRGGEMARARNIKPGFFANEDLAECEPLARLLFAGLWCLADREGRLEDRPKRIRAELLPYDSCDADDLLNQLQARGFILRYSHGSGRFIQVLRFDAHQNPHMKEAKSSIPAPASEVPAFAMDVSGSDGAPDEHSASTSQAPEKNHESPAESGFLIPDSLILNSVPDGTGGAAAKSAADLTKDELWKAGKSLLEQSGMPKAQCGSFVGKLVKDYGNETVVDAVRAAVFERPADPAQYLKAVCMRTAGQRIPINKQEALEQRNRAVAADWMPPEMRDQISGVH